MGTYPHGLFSWTDLSAPDPKAAAEFYTALFGWEAEDQFAPDGTYIYTMLSLDGHAVAGLGPQPEMLAGMPPIWSSYVTVDSVDEVIERVQNAGGSVVAPAMDVMTAGRMAIIAAPDGAVVGLWQEGDHVGSGAFNIPGHMTWNELATRDVEGSKAFWGNVFGWDFEAMPGTPSEYWLIKMEDKPQGDPLSEDPYNGGVMAMDENWPDQVPAHWGVYFSVADTDATLKRITELGGTVRMESMDTPAGRIGVVVDPQGGNFYVISPPA